jgi:hypothetical protein
MRSGLPIRNWVVCEGEVKIKAEGEGEMFFLKIRH